MSESFGELAAAHAVEDSLHRLDALIGSVAEQHAESQREESAGITPRANARVTTECISASWSTTRPSMTTRPSGNLWPTAMTGSSSERVRSSWAASSRWARPSRGNSVEPPQITGDKSSRLIEHRAEGNPVQIMGDAGIDRP